MKKESKKSKKVAFDDRLPFTMHLEELRWRLIVIFITVFLMSSLFYLFTDTIISQLQRPIKQKLIFTSPADALFIKLKVACICGVVFSWPVILFQGWKFVEPGLHEKEKKYGLAVIFGGTAFFVIGSLFAYILVIPLGVQFLLSFATDDLKPMLAIGPYVSMFLKLMIAFGLIFEYPLVILLLSRIGLVNTAFLKKNRKYAIVLMSIVAAILTPPDVVSQMLMFFPLLFLYEISIVLTRVWGKK